MRAGAMRERLQVLQPFQDVDHFGAEKTEYKLVNTIHAERVKYKGWRSELVGEHFPDYSVEFNIRDAHEIKEHWRVQHVGGYLYDVLNIIPNVERGMLTLVCGRVNE